MTAHVSELRADLRHDSSAVATATPRLSWTVATDRAGLASSRRRDPRRAGHPSDHRARVGAGGLAVHPAAARRNPHCSGQGPRNVGGGNRLERPDRHLRRVPRRPDLAGETDRAPQPGRSGPAGPVAPHRPPPTADLACAAVVDSVRSPRRRDQRHRDRRQRPGPGWTSYHDRLIHETTDVTALLTTGENVIGINLAGAWYTEAYGFRGTAKRIYGDQPAALAQLEIDYADGTTETIATDETWLVTDGGPILASGIYAGETYDAARTIDGWSTPGFDPTGWVPAAVSATVAPTPEARIAEPVRRIEERAVAEVITTPSGALVLDFGQNLVGWLKITVSGPAGHEITLRHAEVLENGELGTRPLRIAVATDHYRLAGTGTETWEPRFTYHGFRYAQIDGWPGDFDPPRSPRSWCTATCAEPAGSRVHTPNSTGCTTTSSGA